MSEDRENVDKHLVLDNIDPDEGKFQKTEFPGLVRSEETNAVLNVDNDALKAYKRKKRHAYKVVELEKRVERLEKLLLGNK